MIHFESVVIDGYILRCSSTTQLKLTADSGPRSLGDAHALNDSPMHASYRHCDPMTHLLRTETGRC